MARRMGMTILTVTHMTEIVSPAALYRLLAFLSPAFPIGAFTYSHGLEQVIEDGGVANAAELRVWLEAVLKYGAGRSDAILVKEAMCAAERGDEVTVRSLIDLGLALQPSRERHLETSAQGTAFIDAVRKAWRPPGGSAAADLFQCLTETNNSDGYGSWPYPVAVGVTAAAWGLPNEATGIGFLQAFSANVISVAVRAVPLGQSDGQRVLAAIEPVVSSVAERAQTLDLEDLGTCTFLADIASMKHETQYTRLFRS